MRVDPSESAPDEVLARLVMGRSRYWLIPALAIFAGLLYAVAVPGPDFGPYRAWMRAFVRGDIFELEGYILSPMGVPLSQWSHGTGLLFALASRALGKLATLQEAAMVVGWLAALVFWWAMARLLGHAAKGDGPLTLFGLGATFLGTHAGFYTYKHATESLTYALAAVVALQALKTRRWRTVPVLTVGTATGLLLIVRTYLAIYALPAVALAGYGILRQSERDEIWRKALKLALLLAPIALGGLQMALVNRWMTGSPLSSPYAFGSGAFHSFAWTRPELGAVLLNPFHGLLVYHPLYALCFAALIAWFAQTDSRAVRLACVAVALIVLLNLYVQAAWYVWWLGTETFGMRGMSLAALPLMPVLVRVIARERERGSASTAVWIGLTVLLSAWSYTHLLGGISLSYTFADMLAAQRDALLRALLKPRMVVALALLGGAVVAGGVRVARGRLVPDRAERLTAIAALLLSAMSLSWLLSLILLEPIAEVRRAGREVLVVSLAVTAVLLATTFALDRLSAKHVVDRPRLTGALVGWGLAATFAAGCVLFASLATRTERHIAAQAEPAARFTLVSSIPLEEARGSYKEYRSIPGFEDKKAALLDFLTANGITP